MAPQDFPQIPLLYYNSGTFSRVPALVLAAQMRYLQEFESNPALNLFSGWSRMWEVQKDCAELLGCRAEDLFLRHNVTGSLNDFLLGVRLGPGDIAVSDLEYGAIVNICRLRCEREGRRLRTIHIPPENQLSDPEQLASVIAAQIDDGIRMLMISHVTTGSGLKIPVQILADKLRAKNVVLAIDGAQGAGNHALNLNELENVHFYGGNFHKWFMAPKGTGFGWVPAWFQDQVGPIQGGWTTFERPPVFAPFGGDSRFAQKMLMSNCLSFPTFYALADLCAWWKEKNPATVFRRLEELRGTLEQKALERGWIPVSSAHPALRSPLLALRLPDKYLTKTLELIDHLAREKKTQVACFPYRGQAVLRLSAHVYNDEREFEELFTRLAFLRDT